MFDSVFEGATVVDGTGGEPFTADVAVQDGLIVAIDKSGRITGAAQERISAREPRVDARNRAIRL